jgi:hypothetical protein
MLKKKLLVTGVSGWLANRNAGVCGLVNRWHGLATS